jgi:hypothetical protein
VAGVVESSAFVKVFAKYLHVLNVLNVFKIVLESECVNKIPF